MTNTKTILAQWIEKQKDYLDSSKGKYIHFDNYTTYKKNISDVTNKDKVAVHAFYPFIGYNKNERRFVIDKESGERVVEDKLRPLAYASHFDSLIYSYYAVELGNKYEQLLQDKPYSNSIVAYRKFDSKQSTISIAIEVFKKLLEHPNIEDAIVLTFDVEQFFPSLRHDLLEICWKDLIEIKKFTEKRDHFNVFKHITKYELVDKDELEKALKKEKITPDKLARRYFSSLGLYRDTLKKHHLIKKNIDNKGITQGSAISPLLSNIYMLEFDKLTYNSIDNTNGLYRRYSDDIFIICNKSNYEKICNDVKSNLEKIGLSISAKKSEIFSFIKDINGIYRPHEIIKNKRQDIIYLGIQFNGESVFIKEKTYTRYIKKIRKRAKITVSDAANSNITDKAFTKKLYAKFTHLGKKLTSENTEHRNFISYANKVIKEAEKAGIRNRVREQIKNPIETVNRILKQEKQKQSQKQQKEKRTENIAKTTRRNNHYDNGA